MINDQDNIVNTVKEFIVPNSQFVPGGPSELGKLILEAENLGKKLRVKLGIDPTSSDLHFGHTVCLHYLKKFQERGHVPVLILGGFTATVGDPSGRNEARPPLTHEQVKENSKTYLNQVSKILDLKKVEVHNNYDWLSKLNASDIVKMAHFVTVNQLIAKEAFGTRLSSGEPLYLHETLYPILQGYDSVEIKADIEIGGIDQTFNILFGRHIQKQFNQKEQLAILLPLLIGLDGSKKMSKTFNNYIAINDTPGDIFGKSMSIPDELILHYMWLISSFSHGEINSFEKKLKAGENPRDVKFELACNLVSQLYGNSIAFKEKENFINQFRMNEIPEDIPEYVLDKPLKIIDLLFLSKLTSSKSEAKRLIESGGVKLKSLKVSDPNFIVTLHDKTSVLQVGKRKFVRIV